MNPVLWELVYVCLFYCYVLFHCMTISAILYLPFLLLMGLWTLSRFFLKSSWAVWGSIVSRFWLINNATVTVQWTRELTSLGCILRVELMRHGSGNYLALVSTAQHFTRVIGLICTPSGKVWEFQSLHMPLNTWSCQSFKP